MANRQTGYGALDGRSELHFCDSHLRIEVIGQDALAFGGYSPDSDVLFSNADISVKVRSSLGKETLAPEEHVSMKNSRFRLLINGEEIERETVMEY